MKLLAFGDVHGNEESLKNIEKKSKNCDILAGCGDFSIFEDGLERTLIHLNNLKRPVVLIHGNHEYEEDMRLLSEGKENLFFIHKGYAIIMDFVFFGFGGGGFSERFPDLDKMMKKMLNDVKRFKKENKKIIFLSHASPYDTLLDSIGDNSKLGNKSIRKFIEEAEPLLALSGHLHENFGKQDILKKTLLVNPGPNGMIFNL
ncbi:MAG: uncharacterized protein PWQ87_239 [Candidatus Woesearchaeota archaeon]|nr:uncharacterized protein [Candidatus Woesearchaeota archaeon]